MLVLTGCGPSSTPTSQQPSAPPPFTGQVHEMKMRGTPQKYYYEPEQLIINRGDKVRFVMVEGGPHNVSFSNPLKPDDTKIPPGAKVVLENQGKLVGVLLQAPGQTYELEFNKSLPIGEYNFVCDPHALLGMKGKIVVNP